ncbi:EthD family reductase [Sedimentitalea sp. JM2-8]|uniref:EthD family reductase n=1 Tax=Sedimentitalea xiamensis TaxID=3050037 RepID=A0ABT7FB19_9RHOB|nr:EthD family reductase [Sedimentitalea xiamensis]MDK3072291.1 EthD family reductase [Sedimentitalea xiamensis]
MAVSLQVIYPIGENTHFDDAYYLDTHMDLVDRHMGPHIERVLVTRGVAGGPDMPPEIYAIATIVFADQSAMAAALKASAPVMADIPKFTDTKPQILIGEVVA